MASRASNFCIDARDPYAQTMWWAQVLGDYRPHPASDQKPGDEECGLQGPGDRWLLFLKVPEPKTVKNRMHICLRPTDRTREEEVERILALGATLADDRRDGERGWAVLADPEGNEFCVLTPYRPGASTGLAEAKATLVEYLQTARDSMLWKLEGLSEYDVRRPLTHTGTNLLGLVKHLASAELGYFGDTFGRPHGIALVADEPGADPNADLYATAEESRADIVDLYHRAWAHAGETFAACDLDDVGTVPWWPADDNTVTLHQVLVHMTTETYRHAGHADILRENLDGRAGRRPSEANMDAGYDWAAHVARVERAARGAVGT